jgi:hypothetical protein
LLKIGVVGGTDGNGHPYSWSALINGFEPKLLGEVPFSTIRDYLKLESPLASSQQARVVAIWSPDSEYSASVARFAKIPWIAPSFEELCSSVDAILHLRDDYSHLDKYLEAYLHLEKPVFLDKPLAISEEKARDRLLMNDPRPWFYSSSALRHSRKLSGLEFLPGDSIEIEFGGKLPDYLVHVFQSIYGSFRLGVEPWTVESRLVQENAKSVTFVSESDRTLKIAWDKDVLGVGVNTKAGKVLLDDYAFCFSAEIREFLDFALTREIPVSDSETIGVIRLLEAWASDFDLTD